MTEKRDLYNILGVQKDATFSEIKKYYRKLAIRFHPDKNPGDKECEERFKDISKAYKILGDEELRKKYDSGILTGSSDGLSTVLEEFFESLEKQDKTDTPYDIIQKIEIDLETAITGGKVPVEVDRLDICSKCEGDGVDNRSSEFMCNTCKGVGYEVNITGTVCCSVCKGSGIDPRVKKCTKCNGDCGFINKLKIKVKIKAGTVWGERLKIKNKGNQIPKNEVEKYGERSSVYLVINVTPSKGFMAIEDSLDIIYEVKISLLETLTGFVKEIKFVNGHKWKIGCEGGIRHGDFIEYEGLGYPNGRLLCKVFVDIKNTGNNSVNRLIDKLKPNFDGPLKGKKVYYELNI